MYPGDYRNDYSLPYATHYQQYKIGVVIRWTVTNAQLGDISMTRYWRIAPRHQAVGADCLSFPFERVCLVCSAGKDQLMNM